MLMIKLLFMNILIRTIGSSKLEYQSIANVCRVWYRDMFIVTGKFIISHYKFLQSWVQGWDIESSSRYFRTENFKIHLCILDHELNCCRKYYFWSLIKLLRFFHSHIFICLFNFCCANSYWYISASSIA